MYENNGEKGQKTTGHTNTTYAYSFFSSRCGENLAAVVFKENSDEADRCELRKLYGKSRLQQMFAEIDAEILQNVIVWIANTDANKNHLR